MTSRLSKCAGIMGGHNLFYELFMKVLSEIYGPSYGISSVVGEPSMWGTTNARKHSDEYAVPGGHRVEYPIFCGVVREEESAGNVLGASACRFERRNNPRRTGE
jgi:hypothetical protein